MAGAKQQNWPQFRGPESNMLASSKNLPEESRLLTISAVEQPSLIF